MTLRLPGGHSRPAHRYVLALNADYFQTRFASAFADASSSEIDLIELDGEEAQQLVAFFYGETTLPFTSSSELAEALLGLLRLGRRFMAGPLLSVCLQELVQLAGGVPLALLHEVWQCVGLLEAAEREGVQRRMVRSLLVEGVGTWSEETLLPLLNDAQCCRDLQKLLLQLA